MGLATLKVPGRTVTLSERVLRKTADGKVNTWLAKAVWEDGDVVAISGKTATFSPSFVPDQWVIRITHAGDGGIPASVISFVFVDEDDVEWHGGSGPETVDMLAGDDDPGDLTLAVSTAAIAEIDDASFPTLKITHTQGTEHASRVVTVRVKARAKNRAFTEVTSESSFGANTVTPL